MYICSMYLEDVLAESQVYFPEISSQIESGEKMELVAAYKVLANTMFVKPFMMHKRFVWMVAIRNHLRKQANPDFKYYEEIKHMPNNHIGLNGLPEHFLYTYDDENQCWSAS